MIQLRLIIRTGKFIILPVFRKEEGVFVNACNTSRNLRSNQLLAVAEGLPADGFKRLGKLDALEVAIAAYHHLPMEIENDEARQLRFFFEWNQKDSLQEVVEKLNMFEHVTMAVENGKLMVS